jgi:Tfp pilus assembly protein PilF
MQRVKSAGFVRVGVETVARLILVMALASLAAGCNQTGLTPSPVPNPVTGQDPGDVKYYPSDQPVRLGTQRFYDGNFGLAQQYFQDAVEKSPEDVMAWIGLAASYDRLGRFDRLRGCGQTRGRNPAASQ